MSYAKISPLTASLSLFVLAVMPLYSADIFVDWNAAEGDLGEASNWNPEVTPELSGVERWEIRNGGTAMVSDGQNYGIGLDILIATSSGSGSLILNGDSTLTIKRYLSIGHSGSGQGEVTLNDASNLTIENGYVLVGQRSNGILTVAPEATLLIQKGNMKIGEGQNGTLNLSGTVEVPVLFFGSIEATNAEQNGLLNFFGPAKLTVAKGIVFNSTGYHVVHITGSGGEFSATALDVSARTGTFRFEADSGGVTPIHIAGLIQIDGAHLEVNVDAYNFKNPAEKLPLFEGESIDGEFSEVTWLGKKKAVLKYDTENGQIYLVAK